ncbi:nucleotidyltransferase domain-containing protein [Christiangramia sp. OXR-203]|uniref:nucleotidyltransferase domain-containing protein n=1 Tax=Christiangramia sp. OXR-203 TaxID=3100176 RepID=UPI002AC8FC65|nr:nucleotidyltransferase domain-containing protein [Christiangramia sp. OXR-203]WPY97622.1 nucleotidyltransferase domain-containing protein [Christiangramia sp. OXR-203]
MELEEINKELEILYEELEKKLKNVHVYLFGSILNNPKKANDLDILILYNDIDQVKFIKEKCDIINLIYPIHILYLTFQEEKELQFTSEQNTKLVFKI